MDLSLVSYIPCPASEELTGEIYRECLKNHAAAMGGQAFDGCGEFMPGFKGETLKCAVCGCHRNFHRREISPDHSSLVIHSPAPVAFFPPHDPSFHNFLPPESPVRRGSETPPRRQEGLIRKRYRTKFTTEQKEKMRIFAEKLGWRIQKHDYEALEKFCIQTGVKRHVLKVWMHNHKNNFSSPSGGERDANSPPPSSIRV
ncbi:hypothetical protein M5K25_022757 [Dendrobium thyrsiflorum]|uniref:ZF-HD dimerization-type domain-containing protein n=1 Tax=Dendrobium thyrsiflorum TaxID=117978 RepID=A0ABD0U6N0_DENTH